MGSEKNKVSDSDRLDSEHVRHEFVARRRIYEALLAEVEFIVFEEIENSDIRIHACEGRIKNIDSILKKCVERDIKNPFEALNDIVGYRVICLFRDDIGKISSIIEKSFNIVECEDKINTGDDVFGYMSLHYICQINSKFQGPRYHKIKDINFEIQIRTLSMHAWASMSHYLSYKGEWDVPSHLKKALNALSGLFYVADNEFAQFYNESLKSRETLREIPSNYPTEEINLDTLFAYLARKYPDRRRGDSDSVSELVRELKEAGYETVERLDKDIDKAKEVFEDYEESISKTITNKKFADIGAVRISLSILSDKFIEIRKRTTDHAIGSDDFKMHREKFSIVAEN